MKPKETEPMIRPTTAEIKVVALLNAASNAYKEIETGEHCVFRQTIFFGIINQAIGIIDSRTMNRYRVEMDKEDAPHNKGT